MSVYLDRVEIFNFKSFRGRVVFGPLRRFTAIIGPNGSGKSNIMDAISFVTAAKTSNLRAKQLKELIYGMPMKKPVARSAYVTATFRFEDDTEKSFTRSIHGNSCTYKIDDQVIEFEAYLSELNVLGLNAKAMNFLILQGEVESITMKTPKEKTQMIEEISNSFELKAQYESLRDELLKAKNNVRYISEKKRDLLATKRSVVLEQEEAERYQYLNEKYLSTKSKLQLFELYHIKKDIDNIMEEANEKLLIFDIRENDKNLAINLLQRKKKAAGALSRELGKIEQDLVSIEVAFQKKEAEFTMLEEKLLYWQKKLNSANSLLTEARLFKNSHEKTIQELRGELQQVEELKVTFEDNMATQLISRGSSIELSNTQVQEYFQLKSAVQQQSMAYVQRIDAIKWEQNIDENKLDNEDRKCMELEMKLQKKKAMRDEIDKRLRKLQQCVKEAEDTLANKAETKSNLEGKIIENREKLECAQREYLNVCEQLGDAKIDKHATSRLKRKKDTLKILQELFPGVYNRLSELCKPIHFRYNIAVRKAFGKYMDAIVVTTSKVADQCIYYLKEQQIGVETFLPLDSLQVPPLKEKLRDIKDPKYVRLLFDVLSFSPEEISNAVLFVTKNTLVCEAPEDARIAAYELGHGHRYDCVALDGTFYHKHGIISGGQAELLRKAKVWEDQQLSELKLRKVQLMEEIREISKMSQLESELSTANMQIHGLTTKWKYIKYSLTDAEKQIATLSAELDVIEQELRLVRGTCETIKQAIQERNKNIENIEAQIHDIEDIIFSEFCQNIGVMNVRQYENGGLRLHEEQTKRKLELEEQCNRIRNLLDYELKRDSESAIIKNQEAVKTAERKLQALRNQESIMKSDIDIEKRRLQEKEILHKEMKMEMVQLAKNIEECRHRLAIISRSLQDAGRDHNIVLNKIERKKADFHAILKESKAQDISVPTLSERQETPSTSYQSEKSDQDIFSQINFTSLPENMKSRAPEDIYAFKTQLKTQISELQNEMTLIQNPNLKATNKLSSTLEEIRKVNKEFQDARKTANEIKVSFEKLKQERYNRFAKCFDRISTALDYIYKSLVNDRSAQAFLLPENVEEPYLGGINYSCIVPGKRYHPMANLSGGEQTLAALALLFAMHSFKPSPFFLLDEVDAALDNANIQNVVRFIRSRRSTAQFIIVSLKKELFSYADALVGVCSQRDGDFRESLIFTLALADYPPRSKKQKAKPTG